MYIVVPKPDSLDDFYVIPDNWETQEDNFEHTTNGSKDDIFNPKPKTTKDKKRKPNEALITDKRFNIDALSKSVVY